MTKKYICYVVKCDNNLGYILEDNNKNNNFYNSFEELIQDVDKIDFKLDNNSISLNECETIFQFKIKKKGSPDGTDGNDSSLTIEVKSEILTITDKSKQHFEELKKMLELDDKRVTYSIIVDNAEPVKLTLLGIFELFIRIFFAVESSADKEVKEVSSIYDLKIDDEVAGMVAGESGEAMKALAERDALVDVKLG